MISRGRNAANARHIARSIIRDSGRALNAAQKNQVINRYFELIKSLDDLPDAAVRQRFFGDLGKLMFSNGQVNTGFIRGTYQHLEIIDDLRNAGRSVASLEEGFDYATLSGNSVRRYTDIKVVDDDLIESKNLLNYAEDNARRVVNGLDKELGNLVARNRDATDAADALMELDRIKFVFRGSAKVNGSTAQAKEMIEAMQRKGNEVIGSFSNDGVEEIVRKEFNKRIKMALESLETNKILPGQGEMIVFQGRRTPY